MVQLLNLNEDKETVHFVINDDDVPFEEEILRCPKSIKPWLRYIESRIDSPSHVINMIYERALKELPGSYKLWYNYLLMRQEQTFGRCITDPMYEEVNNCFERSLVFMNKMPRIWINYCEFLVGQCKITRTRRVFDRALRALPITQHDRIWPIYVAFIKQHPIPETAVRVFRRYLQLCPDEAEEFIEYLISIDRLDDAAVQLASVVNNRDFVSKHGKSNHALWNQLCDLICKNPHKVKSLNVDAIIRGGLRRYTDQTGHLWNSLADYYIRSGLFERARDIYEEAIGFVTTVRDFSQIFDAYAQFEEISLSKLMEKDEAKSDNFLLDLHLARFEDLISRRPLLLNSVLLRQNPHNVPEWLKRVTLIPPEKLELIIDTFTEAVQTVDPKLSVGRLELLWIEFAKFYEKNNQLDDARIIFDRASSVAFVKVESLANVWCEWVEMELRHDNHEETLKLLRRAVAPPPRRISYHDAGETVQARLHKSLKVWSLYADLEESFGTFKSTKDVYDRILELRIATPQIVINFGLFLKENKYFEEAFKAYEKGIGLFRWPNVYDVWSTYLTEFLERYGGSKLERVRDLFEQCLESCPSKFAKAIYLLYAKLEEEHGMARHAMAVYDRAVEAVEASEAFNVFNIYLQKAASIYGVTRTRPIYEKAIAELSDESARIMCVRFADMETKLGEIDRARAIYSHASQMCDPRVTPEFWEAWKAFEVKHGNEDTLREMLRIRRSVQNIYNTQVNIMSAQMVSADEALMTGVETAHASSVDDTTKQKSELAKSGNITFIRGLDQSEDVTQNENMNPDEIDLEDEVGDLDMQTQVPDKVFGSLKPSSEAYDDDETQPEN